MLPIFIFLSAGALIGFFLRSYRRILRAADYLSAYAVYFLLFTLGIAIGSNREIISNIRNLGFSAVLIAFGSVCGSVAAVQLVGKILFKNGEHS